ncbi:MLP-like protein 423 [Dorcoceras hygrometricum]|uniref:MLP-like protein 423 n=1 Tax=Dorcoceras hygrometricum TaxID=472368 RepID=A0A2Z7CCR7_9LAMI|nr:MLP-like protein 423 [Dorcoceras hygrometricum]
MAQLVKVDSEAQIKSTPAKFYNLLKNDMTRLVDMFPGKFESAQLLEGTDGCVGNVKLFKFNLGERRQTMKVRLNEINDEERILIYESLEGNHTKIYSSFKSTITVRDGSVKIGMEVEKANDSAPNPDRYLTFAVETVKAVDAYLLNH